MSDEQPVWAHARVTDGWYIVCHPMEDDTLQRVEDGRMDDGGGDFALTLLQHGYTFRPVEIIPVEERERWREMNAALAARIAELEAALDAARETQPPEN